MSKIVSKLNLNRTPQLVENNSLIMAKNIRLLEDGTIGPDTSLINIETETNSDLTDSNIPRQYIGQIIGLNDKVYFFMECKYVKDSVLARDLISTKYDNAFIVNRSGELPEFNVNKNGYITRNGELYEDLDIARASVSDPNERIKIYSYDENTQALKMIYCAWKYSGGKINGCVSINNTGEQILTIAEYDVPNNVLVPLKHINLTHCKLSDDESIYTQAPNIPITNLLFIRKYTCAIPSGVYQFFIRYEIKDEFYTDWFPCSNEVFAGSDKLIDTAQGSLRYIDSHEDSSQSFVFSVTHLYPNYCRNFNKFQIGFILSYEDGIFARSWKSFDFKTEEISFDYNNEFIKEINIDDLLKTNYDLYNVKNVVNFKNRLYISNFIETDFNDNTFKLKEFARNFTISLKTKIIEAETAYKFNGYYVIKENNCYLGYILPSGDGVSFSEIYANELYNTVTQDIGDETHYPFSAGSAIVTNCCYLGKLAIIDNDNNTEYNLIPDNSSHMFYGDDDIIYAMSSYHRVDANIEYNNYVTNAINECVNIIKNIFAYVDEDLNYYISYNNAHIKANKFTFICKAYINNNETTSRDDYVRQITIDIKSNLKIKEVITNTTETQTLLPFTNYDFYCHFIKQNGIVTNGYHIGSCYIKRWGVLDVSNDIPAGAENIIKTSDDVMLRGSSNEGTYSYSFNRTQHTGTAYATELPINTIVYPTFTPNRPIPDGYVGYFVSMHKHNNEVSELINQTYYPDGDPSEIWFDCLECDTRLFKSYKNLKIVNWNKDELQDGRYFSSGDTGDNDDVNLKYFGDVGIVVSKTVNVKGSRFWIIGNEFVNDDNKALVKVTPYMYGNNPCTIDNNLNLQGYYCNVAKLQNQNTLNQRLYINGNDIYNLTIDGNDVTDLELKTDKQAIIRTDVTVVHSNYNLGYLSLSQDLNKKIRTYEVTENNVTEQKSQILYTVDSLIASDILTLDKAFKDYTRKLYYVVEDKKITKFNNTIRASNIDSNELYRYIFRFDAIDYYMCPSHRGIITNLISIANTLYVHCEHSLFKFTDNRTINSKDDELTLQENDIFNSGISEVFDAQYGYAGLKTREHSLITFNAYIFYDATTKIIYGFEGQNQVGNISANIKKLIDYVDPTDVRFVADENHNRFFVNLIHDYDNVCLSFNFAAKSFISIHDINFKFGFHTRANTYFIHDIIDNNNNLTGWSIYKIADYLISNNIKYISAYQNCYVRSLIYVYDTDNLTVSPMNEFNCVNSCVDIINNEAYESIKNLEYINWICSEISGYASKNFYAEEALNSKYPGNKIRIYTDSTNTDLLNLLDSNLNPYVSNDENLMEQGTANPNAWQYIRFNCGVWSMNYFRDIRNIDSDEETHPERLNYTQNSSLLYGKYFVVRFVFNNKNFKLENLTLKLSNYGKTK